MRSDFTDIRGLREEVERLRKRNAARQPRTDTVLRDAKRQAADGLATVERTTQLWEDKLTNESRRHALERCEDEARINRYETRMAQNGTRIAALEREVAMLKAAAAEQPSAAAAPSTAAPTSPASGSESLPELLKRLDLEAHAAALQEEEIEDVAILRSMGSDMLAGNMAEVGMNAAEIGRLSADLFG